MTPPPFGSPPRVPPRHVPTLTEVIELGPDPADALSLETAGPDTAGQPAEPADAPMLSDAAAHAPLGAPVTAPPTVSLAGERASFAPEPGPVGTVGYPDLADDPAARATVPPPAPSPAPNGEDGSVTRETASTTAGFVSAPSSATGPTPWRADPDLPAFLLAGRLPQGPQTAVDLPGASLADAAMDAASPTPSWPPAALPVLSEAVEPPPRSAQPPSAWPEASEALVDDGPSAGVAPAEPPADVPAEVPTDVPARTAAVPLPEDWREEQLIQQVLVDVQRRADAMLEFRLREALGPLLSRVTDELVRGARQELAVTLRDVVARAVAQELSRHRSR